MRGGDLRVGPARQDDRHPRPEHDPGRIRIGQEGQALGQHVAGLEVGDDKHVGLPGNRRSDVLDLGRAEIDGVVEGERPVQDAARDLAAVGHLAERRGFDGGRNLRVHGFHGGQDGDPNGLDAERMREIDGVLDDVDLVLQGRGDVDRRIGHDQGRLMARHVHDEAMADPARRPQATVPADDSRHQLVRVQAALHQRLGLAGLDERDGFLGGGMAMGRIDDAERREVHLEAVRRRGDFVPAARRGSDR